MCKLTWRTRSSRACKSRAGSKSPMSSGSSSRWRQPRGREDRGFGGELEDNQDVQAQVQHGEITREGVDELTLRAAKAEQLCTFIDATNVETWTTTLWTKTGLQLDQATYKDVEGAEVKELALPVCGDEQGSQCSQPCGSSRAKTHGKTRSVKEKRM